MVSGTRRTRQIPTLSATDGDQYVSYVAEPD
jgi:hypothetical protein